METIYRVAILGCGPRGTAAALAYHAHPRCEVVAVCDAVQEPLTAVGERLGITARFNDADDMIMETHPDIVVIATGTEFHYDLAMRALAHGVHLDLEKPICTDLEQADALLAKAKQKSVRVAVHHQGRVSGTMRPVATAFAEGRIGVLRYLHASDKGYYGGLGLMNIGTHALNNLLKFGGRCRSVSAVALTGGRPITPSDVVSAPLGMGIIAGEHITATLHFGNHVTASLLAHRFAKMDTAAYGMEITGMEGRLYWGLHGAWWLPQPHFVPDEAHSQWQALEPIAPVSYDPNSGAQRDDYWFAEEYVRALDEDRDHECSGAEALHSLEIIMGIFESGAYGKTVNLPQAQRDHPLLRWRHEHGLGKPEPAERDYGKWLAAEDVRIGKVRTYTR